MNNNDRFKLKNFSLIFKIFCILLIVIGFGGCDTIKKVPVDGATAEQDLLLQDFTFADGGHGIAFSLKLGNPVDKDPIIFFINSGDCTSILKRYPTILDIARNTINADVFVLQKRGIDENSDGKICSKKFTDSDYFERMVADQREYIDYVLNSSARKPKAIVLIGMAEGGLVAARLGAQDKRFTNIALIGSGGSSLRENIKLLSKKQADYKNYQKIFSEIQANSDNSSVMIWNHSYKYWSSILDINISSLLTRSNALILVAMGAEDSNISADTLYNLRSNFNYLHKKNLQIFVFPGANSNLFDQTRSYSYMKDFYHSLMVDIDWVNNH